jgi:hypothetical protein
MTNKFPSGPYRVFSEKHDLSGPIVGYIAACDVARNMSEKEKTRSFTVRAANGQVLAWYRISGKP